MGYQGARRALWSLSTPGLPRRAGAVKLLSASESIRALHRSTEDLGGGELELVASPCQPLEGFGATWVQLGGTRYGASGDFHETSRTESEAVALRVVCMNSRP